MSRIRLLVILLVCAGSAQAQGVEETWRKFVETPAVTGHEQALAAEIRARLKALAPQTDNLGNVYVTLGEGAPHRLIVAPMDEPGYVVSSITADGYLRVQRLPQAEPNGVFDLMHAAQPVVIRTRAGKVIYGVVGGLSTHLQGGRQNAPRGDNLDEIYVDIGAASAEEVRQAGVDRLDSIALDRRLYAMGFGRLTGVASGDRFGAAALVELLARIDRAKLRGKLTVAFVAQQWASSRGMDRLMQQVKPDEMVYVGRLMPRRTGGGPGGGQAAAQRGASGEQAAQQASPPRPEPGSGIVFAMSAPAGGGQASQPSLSTFAAELKKLAEDGKIPVVTEAAAALPQVSYTRGPVMPERFAHIGVPTAWATTPAEFLHLNDLQNLGALLEAYVTGGSVSGTAQAAGPGAALAPPTLPARPASAPSTADVLRYTTEAYGMSGKEKASRETIAALLPSWAKPETDEAGNLFLRMGTAPEGSKAPRIVIVAHSDEIGYSVTGIGSDGRLAVRSVGGGITEFFRGHTMFVHTESGIRPGIMDLPAGWEATNFEWPRGFGAGGAAPARVDVGARSAAEVEQLGIKVGDWMTVPKKYRPLYGKRANARSFDDRVGSTALVLAAWMLGPNVKDRDVTLVWATEEEVGLRGAKAFADRLAEQGKKVDFVFAVDTFVSSDSPLESKRFADAAIGKGFVVRAVDGSNIVPLEVVDKVIALAQKNKIAVQWGVTGGGNDGAVFLRHGAVDVPIGWALRYSHSPGEVIDTRDVDALAAIVAAISRSW